MLPNPGTYSGKRNGAIVVQENESGSTMALIPYRIVGAEGVHFTSVHYFTLVSRAGEPQQRNIKTLAKCFPQWDWENGGFGALQDLPAPTDDDTPEFDLQDCFHEEYTPEGKTETSTRFKVQWFNPPGGSAMLPEPASAEQKKAIKTKWASRLKAIMADEKPKAAQAAAAKSTPAPAKSAPAPAKKSLPPGKSNATHAMARTMTQQEVWDAITKVCPAADVESNKEREEWGEKFFLAQEKVKPGANGELSITEWGKVADELGV